MALTAILEFGNNDIKQYPKKYMVSKCHFVFNKDFNEFRPIGAARCERVELEVVVPGQDDLTLFEWYTSQNINSGRIVMDLSSDQASDHTPNHVLYFEDAKCFALSENYNIASVRRRILRLSISAELTTIEEVEFK